MGRLAKGGASVCVSAGALSPSREPLVQRLDMANSNHRNLGVPMSERAQDLAARFVQAMADFKAFVEEIPKEQWGKPVSAGDPRTVGVVARHIAWAYVFEWGHFRAITEGHPLPPVPEFESINAEHAQEWSSISKDDVLLELGSAEAVAAQIRGLSDEQLAREGLYSAGRPIRTIDELIDRVLIGHIGGHMAEMRAAIAV